ncbi:MAG: cytochrome c biogenesis protein CcsA [Verrucomicrobiae bacterium]|nr:cytochrome c biogenesis protein CcsA [Verrucomicrobiae bacterium]
MAPPSLARFCRRLIDLFCSLQLTVVLLALAMIVVLAGTLAQVSQGLYLAQENFFNSFWIRVPISHWSVPVFPGGSLIVSLLLLNLLAAHARRFVLTWKKAGIFLIHSGLILMLSGQLLTSFLAEETQLAFEAGQSRTFSENRRIMELALRPLSAEGTPGTEILFSQNDLRPGASLTAPGLPLVLTVESYHENATLRRLEKAPASDARGLALQWEAQPLPRVRKLDEVDMPALALRLQLPGDPTPQRWLLSRQMTQPQRFWDGERFWEIQLRGKRQVLPFAITLREFVHERYPGTETPKRFESKVTLTRTGEPPRQAVIHMNHPLRAEGLTFFQGGFSNGDTTSILQIVRNPAWPLPYVSCLLVTLGLLAQFASSLWRTRTGNSAAVGRTTANPSTDFHRVRIGYVVIVLLVLLPTLTGLWKAAHQPWAHARTLPVLVGGRVQPVDSAARHALLVLRGREDLPRPGKPTLSATEWFLEVIFRPEQADENPVFLIRNPEVLDSLGLPAGPKGVFTFKQLEPLFLEIIQQAKAAEKTEAPARNAFQRAILHLDHSLGLYAKLRQSWNPGGAVPLSEMVRAYGAILEPGSRAMAAWNEGRAYDPALLKRFADLGRILRESAEQSYAAPVWPARPRQKHWHPIGQSLLNSVETGVIPAATLEYAALEAAYTKNDGPAFDRAADRLREMASRAEPRASQKVWWETALYTINPFGMALWFYGAALVLALAAPSRYRPPCLGLAFWLMVTGLVCHTAGLGLRMWIMDRPPVTNLYSSAIFVAWAGVLLALPLERWARDGMALIGGAALGLGSLLVAHHLAASGDTMEVLQAVLDTNLWLSTHVVVITLGYAATFLAGFFGILYLMRARFETHFSPVQRQHLESGLYVTLCLALLLSFVGTVLGGLWADQSWGRFWGWDPKENGALLIILWNALILHARWGGLIRSFGLAQMAVFGNIVTAFSWFGTNMLGIGLHSYGFMDAAFWGLAGFCLVQLLIMVVGWKRARV